MWRAIMLRVSQFKPLQLADRGEFSRGTLLLPPRREAARAQQLLVVCHGRRRAVCAALDTRKEKQQPHKADAASITHLIDID
ncbi:hypothetical protein MRX96_006901 [Rhipicephalus microplus]